MRPTGRCSISPPTRVRRRLTRPPSGGAQARRAHRRTVNLPCGSPPPLRLALIACALTLRAAALGFSAVAGICSPAATALRAVDHRLARPCSSNTRVSRRAPDALSGAPAPRLAGNSACTHSRPPGSARRRATSVAGPRHHSARARLGRVAGPAAPQTLSARLPRAAKRPRRLSARPAGRHRAHGLPSAVSSTPRQVAGLARLSCVLHRATPWWRGQRGARSASAAAVCAGQQLDIELADGRIPAQALQGGTAVHNPHRRLLAGAPIRRPGATGLLF